MDVVANESNKQKFRREFEEKKVKRVKKISILEERKMKRMVKNNGIVHYKNTDSSANLDHMMKIDEKVPEKTYDLWGESNQTESIFKFPNSKQIPKPLNPTSLFKTKQHTFYQFLFFSFSIFSVLC